MQSPNDDPAPGGSLPAEDASNSPDSPPPQGLAATLRRVHSRFLMGLLLAYAVAAGVGIGIVLLHPVRDWFLFVAMYLVVLAYMATYLKAHQRRRPILKLIGLGSSEALIGYWCFILIDRIPARKVFVDGQIQTREALLGLWASVALLILVAIGLLVHWAWIGRLEAGAAQAGPTRETTE